MADFFSRGGLDPALDCVFLCHCFHLAREGLRRPLFENVFSLFLPVPPPVVYRRSFQGQQQLGDTPIRYLVVSRDLIRTKFASPSP